MSSLSRVKVKSTTHVYPPINPVADHEILLTGEIGVLYGIRFVSSKPLVPLKGDMFADVKSGTSFVWDGSAWQTLGSAESLHASCDKSPSQVSYLKGVRVKSITHPKPLRGQMRSLWAVDEVGFYNPELTMKKLSALGISPEFLKSDSVFDNTKADAYMDNVKGVQQAVANVLQSELEKLLLTSTGTRVNQEVGSTVASYLSGVLH